MLLQGLGWVINFEKSDLTPSQDFQFLGMQFNTRQFTVTSLPKMRLKVQSVHQHWMTNPIISAHNLHRLLGLVVFMAMLVRRGRLHLQQHGARGREQVPQDHSLSESSAGSGLVGISSSPARSSPRHPGKGNHSLHWCVQLGLRSPIRLTLYTGTVVSISEIIAHKRSGDAGRHQRCEGFPALSEVLDGSLDVRQSQLPTSRTKGALNPTLSCNWRCACWSGAIARQSSWSQSICQECAMSRRMHCPELARLSTPRGRWPWSVFNECLPSGANHRSTCLLHLPTDDLSSLQVLQKIYQSQGVQMILVAPMQETASWYLELLELSQEDSIPLYVQGQPLLTQDVILSDRGTATRHYRPSNLHAWRLCGPS